jgi:hypothetical protein
MHKDKPGSVNKLISARFAGFYKKTLRYACSNDILQARARKISSS